MQTLLNYIKLWVTKKAPCSRVQMAGQSRPIILILSSVVLWPLVALIVLTTRAIAFALVQHAMCLRKVFQIRKSVPSVDGIRTFLQLTFSAFTQSWPIVFQRLKDTSQTAIGSLLYRSVRSCYAVVIFYMAIKPSVMGPVYFVFISV